MKTVRARPLLVVSALAVAALLACAHTESTMPQPGGTAAMRLVDGSHAPMPAACGSTGSKCSEEVSGSGGWQLQLYRNFPMTGSSTPTQAVVVIHGTGRNAAGYFASMMSAASKAGIADRTLVVAPWFKTSEDKPAGKEGVWVNDAWKAGTPGTPSSLSSFAVIDQVMSTLADKKRFPNLKRITLAGHSAGGQFTQRYAAFGKAPNALAGVAINYVVANPSSFVYFDATRPQDKGFAVPSSSSCADYNQYKYGMAGRTGYPATVTPTQAAANYTSRQVTILGGSDDTVDNGDLDTDCGANLQGPNRAVRSENYLAYIHKIAPNAPHARVAIPGVAHESDAMFASPLAWPALFGVQGTQGAQRMDQSR